MSQSVVEKASITDQVFAWRMEALMRMGYEIGRAESLACTDMDIRRAERLIAEGCPLDLVVRILT